jgi:hypothetical protein
VHCHRNSDGGVLIERIRRVANSARGRGRIVEPATIGRGLADALVVLVVGVAEGDAARGGRRRGRGRIPRYGRRVIEGVVGRAGAILRGRKHLDGGARGRPLPQITPANGLAKQGFSATGK